MCVSWKGVRGPMILADAVALGTLGTRPDRRVPPNSIRRPERFEVLIASACWRLWAFVDQRARWQSEHYQLQAVFRLYLRRETIEIVKPKVSVTIPLDRGSKKHRNDGQGKRGKLWGLCKSEIDIE